MGPLLSSPRKKYLVLDSPPPFFLGGERPASGFQSEQPSPFSVFFAFSLSCLSPLVVLGESENEIVALCPHSVPSQHRPVWLRSPGNKGLGLGDSCMHAHHTHACTHVDACAHKCAYAHTHVRAQECMHADACGRMYTHAHRTTYRTCIPHMEHSSTPVYEESGNVHIHAHKQKHIYTYTKNYMLHIDLTPVHTTL